MTEKRDATVWRSAMKDWVLMVEAYVAKARADFGDYIDKGGVSGMAGLKIDWGGSGE